MTNWEEQVALLFFDFLFRFKFKVSFHDNRNMLNWFYRTSCNPTYTLEENE